MRTKSPVELAILHSIFWLLLMLPKTSLSQTYTIQLLSSNAWSYSAAHGLNILGNVVGEYESTNFFHVQAFLYEAGKMSDLGHLPGTPYTIAYGINDTNAIVGESGGNVTHAFLFSNGAMTDLGTFGSAQGGYSSAHAVNRARQIVGEASESDVNVIHAILYSGSTNTDLGALGGDYSSANAINNSAVIVGESDVVQAGVTNVHAFVFTNGVSTSMTDLGTLGGAYSSAKGINDSGVIVGEAETLLGGVSYLHAFIYQEGVMTDLGTLGGQVSSASAIDSAGHVVGYSTDVNEVAHAFFYDGATMLNLDNYIPLGSGWTNLASADAINDAGQLAGSGYLADGTYSGYLLTPAPPLVVAITNPAANAGFRAPANLVVSATAWSTAGAVTNVQFEVNGDVIGNATSAPYSATTNNVPAGAYTLRAVASDNTGLMATNSVSITVTNAALPVITISNPTYTGSNFSFSFGTQAGYTYEGEFTSPLAPANNWVVFTNAAGDGSVHWFTDWSLTNGQRYYRVVAH